MRYIFKLGCLLLISSTIRSAELTLEGVLTKAESHSYNRRANQALTEAASGTLDAARSERLPTLSINATAYYVSEIPTLNLSVPGVISASQNFGVKDSYLTDIRLHYPLYTGGRVGSTIDMATADHQRRQATEAAQRNLRYLQTRLEYFGLEQAIQLHRAAGSSLRRTEILQANIQSRYDAGAADSVALLEASLGHTRAGFALKNAAINVRTSQIRLLIRLGLTPDDTLVLSDNLPDPILPQVPVSVSITRPEVDVAEAAISLSQSRLQLTKGEYMPSLSLLAGYSYGKPNFNPFEDDWQDRYSFGARLHWSFNLGNKTGAQKRSAVHNLASARDRKDATMELIALDIGLAFEKLTLAYEQFAAAKDEYRITNSSYRLAEQKHRQGDLSANRLLEIETDLTNAESALAAARVGYYIAQSGYYFATGSEKLREGL